MNLLSNAVEACDRSGMVIVRTRNEGQGIRVEVEDNGSGIEPEKLDRVFDPFFTTKPVGEGTGLGLSISYGIVQAHRGSIVVRSERGKGTVFSVFLPCDPSGDRVRIDKSRTDHPEKAESDDLGTEAHHELA